MEFTMKYDITKSDSHKFIYYRVPKTATRSILFCLAEKTVLDFGKPVILDGYDVDYNNDWNNYFQFAFVRNPFDRILSCFIDKTKNVIGTKWELEYFSKYKHSSFEEFVMDLDNDSINQEGHTKEQHLMINLNRVDFIGKFENLNQDFKYVCENLNIAIEHIPHRNATDHDKYQNYYNDKTIAKIKELYSKDMELFQYEYN